MDFGAGVGRLAQCLALQHGLDVCGLDCSEGLRIKAEKRADWLARSRRGGVQRAASGWAGRAPRAVTARVGPEMGGRALEALWAQAEGSAEEQGQAHRPGRLLVGLHSCGELTPTMLRIFCQAHRESASGADGGDGEPPRGVVVVGCCYNLLEGELPEDASASRDADKTAEERVRYPLRTPQPGEAELTLTRRLCAAAAESTNPAFVSALSEADGGRGAPTSLSTGVGSLRPRRLAR